MLVYLNVLDGSVTDTCICRVSLFGGPSQVIHVHSTQFIVNT